MVSRASGLIGPPTVRMWRKSGGLPRREWRASVRAYSMWPAIVGGDHARCGADQSPPLDSSGPSGCDVSFNRTVAGVAKRFASNSKRCPFLRARIFQRPRISTFRGIDREDSNPIVIFEDAVRASSAVQSKSCYGQY